MTTAFVLSGGGSLGAVQVGMLQALLSQQQILSEVSRHTGPARLKVLPPLCPLSVSAADFAHAPELIARAHEATGSWLDAGGPDLPEPQQFLALHGHGPGRGDSGSGASSDEVVDHGCSRLAG